ncbi:MAG: GNA1162 family protein [Elusimicrobiota bacterium]
MRFRVQNSEFRSWGHSLCFVILTCCVLLLSSCAPKAKYIIENYSPPKKIAILPFTNQSVDFDAPVLLRYLFGKRLDAIGYNTISFEEIDAKLQEMGITDAGQLPTINPKELGEKLDVDGLVYGDVIEFKYTTLGFYFARTVQANFKLFDAKNTLLLWEDERKVSHKKFEFENIGKAFADQLIEKMVDKALRSPLKAEANEVVNTSVQTLLRRSK